jgi:hypothetical protein
MNQVKLWEAIRARALADTGSGGLFETGEDALITGIYNTLAPPTVVDEDDPYIVFSVASASQNDAFNMDVIEYTIRFSVFSPVTSGLAVPSAIIDRLYGNGVGSSGNLATYGFHRWQPSLSGSSWGSSVMYRIDQDTAHSESVYNFVETYKVICSLV